MDLSTIAFETQQTLTRKATCGNIVNLGTSPISWNSFISKTTVALFTAEGEYIILERTHNNLLTELGYPQNNILLF